MSVMKKIIYYFTTCLLFISMGCQKEISFTSQTSGSEPVTAILQGNVVDENGNPASGVTITVGAKTTATDAKGYFRIRNASLDKSVSLVTAEKAGYFKALRVFSASKAVNQVKIKLLKKTLAGSLNASAGGIVSLSNGSTITFNANSFSKASGGTYSGTVSIYAAYIDPTREDIGETVPGSFLADDKDNKRVLLSSYGMMAVELESASGEKLQITAGNTARLSFSIPSGLQASAPNNIALWYVDEQTGLWKEEGTAIKNGTIYSGEVKHFTYWNCDVPGPTVNVTASFINTNGLPLMNADVRIRPASGYASAHGYTDSLGQINGPVPANINLVLEVRAPYPCYNVVYSQNIGPFSTNTNLGTITVNNTNQYMVSIQGRLLTCAGSPVTHGFAIIEYDNMIRYVSVSSSGNFSTTAFSCSTSPATCTVTGVDSLGQQQSTPVTFPVTSPTTNTGDISACGTSTIQYINYIIDGSPVNLSSTTAGDQFNAFDTAGPAIHMVAIRGYRSQAENISFGYHGNGSPGTFSLSYLNISSYRIATPVLPFTISIINHPPIGGYFEGNFAGQFKDSANVAHSISSLFRVKNL